MPVAKHFVRECRAVGDDDLSVASNLTPRWDPTITLGHVLTALTMIGGAMAIYSNFNAQFATIAGRFDIITTRVETRERAAQRYIPMVEEMARANMVQDERIGNLAKALIEQRQEQRETNAALLSQMGMVRENLAKLNARLDPGGSR